MCPHKSTKKCFRTSSLLYLYEEPFLWYLEIFLSSVKFRNIAYANLRLIMPFQMLESWENLFKNYPTNTHRNSSTSYSLNLFFHSLNFSRNFFASGYFFRFLAMFALFPLKKKYLSIYTENYPWISSEIPLKVLIKKILQLFLEKLLRRVIHKFSRDFFKKFSKERL